MPNIVILGAGGFGTALAVMCRKYDLGQVTLWTPFQEEAASLEKAREHVRLLPGIPIPQEVDITTSLEALGRTDLAIIATPSAAVRATARSMAEFLPEGVAVTCVSKGIEAGTFHTLSAIIGEELPKNPVIILSGPSHAEEVATGKPTTVVAASRSRAAAEFVQDTLMNDGLRIYANDDVLGVELGGALKNVIALAAGVVDGLGIGGDNTKAALMTRGITEIARLGVALGAKTETFGGLSGIGDLIVTCSSMHSRNRRCGILIGQGKGIQRALEEIGMTVEGYPCTETAYLLAKKHGITMPIVEAVYHVLYQGEEPAVEIQKLMARPKRHESETIWLLTR